MYGFIAQLVEHRTGIAEVTGSNPVEALIFSGFFSPIAYIGNLTAMIILHFHPQPQFKYELFHIFFTIFCSELTKDSQLVLPGPKIYTTFYTTKIIPLVKKADDKFLFFKTSSVYSTCCYVSDSHSILVKFLNSDNCVHLQKTDNWGFHMTPLKIKLQNY